MVRPWWDPELAVGGFPPGSVYFETYWLPVLGPSATLALRLLSRGLADSPSGYEVDILSLSRRLGLGRSRSRNGPAARAVQRLCHFGLARRTEALEVRTHVPVLPAHLAKRLPVELRAGHRDASQAQIRLPATPPGRPRRTPHPSGPATPRA